MSIQAVSWVLEHSDTRGSDRLVLLSIANHANDEWEAWPSTATIQLEANVSRENTVNEALARLVETGAIERTINGAPDQRIRRDRRPNLYRIMRSVGHPCRSRCCWCDSPPSGVPSDGAGSRVTDERGPAESRHGVPRNGTQTITEPSLEPSKEILPSSGSPAPRPEIDDLCEFLAAAIAAHRHGIRPKISERWRKDMRLLVDRGPLHIDNAEPLSPDRVRVSIAFVFSQLAEPTGRDGFCWADQVRSPAALRDHWGQLADAARRLRNKRRDPLAPATIETVADPLAGPQLALSRGGDGR